MKPPKKTTTPRYIGDTEGLPQVRCGASEIDYITDWIGYEMKCRHRNKKYNSPKYKKESAQN